MVEVLEMGAIPFVEKVIIPALKPQVNIVSATKSSSSWGWIILLIIVCVAAYLLYHNLKEQPEEIELLSVQGDD